MMFADENKWLQQQIVWETCEFWSLNLLKQNMINFQKSESKEYQTWTHQKVKLNSNIELQKRL